MNSTAKDALRRLVKETASLGAGSNWPVEQLRGIALHDTQRDSLITPLSSFDGATHAVTEIPEFATRFGAAESKRTVLQFVYQYFERVATFTYETDAFESLWLDFTVEVQQANWVYRGIANLKNFKSESLHLDLGDGVVIRGRNFAELPLLGFSAAVLSRIWDDWQVSAPSFVMVAEHITPKHPDNVRLDTDLSVWTKTRRAIGALRLAAPGPIAIGPMWVARPCRFKFGTTGLFSVAFPTSSPFGSPYVWTEEVAPSYSTLYAQLAQLEKVGYGNSPGNLEIALRAFNATYDIGRESRLLDAITAFEALLGTETEIAFKLAFRVAALLAASDAERGTLLKLIRGLYDTRSKLVHGSHLKQKHQDLLHSVDQAISLLRRLLKAFVAFATNPPQGYPRSFFDQDLDVALIDGTQREKLRSALGLDQN